MGRSTQQQSLREKLRSRRRERKEKKAARKGMRDAFKHLPSLLPYLKRFWYLGILAVVLTAISAATGVAEPWPLAFLVDSVLGKESIPGWIKDIFGSSTGSLILVAVFAGVVIAFVTNTTQVWNKYVQTKLAEKMVLDFRSDLFQHVQRLSLTFHGMKRKGSLMYAVNTQAKTMGEITIGLLPLLEGSLRLLGMFVVAYKLDSELALLALTVVPFIYYAIGYYGRNIDPELRKVRGMEATSLSIVYEAMSMIKVILAFGREDHEFQRFRKQGERAVDARVKLTVKQTSFSLAVNVIMAAGTGLVLWFGAQHVLDKQLSIGQLLIIMSYIAAVYRPLEQISTTLTNLQEQLISLEAALDLMAIAPDVKDPPNGIDLGRAQGRVTFEGVTFNYPGREHTLTDLSFDVAAGSRVAIVGPTGAGKSTLVSMIPRFMDATGGKILIDGADVKNIGLNSLRSQVSLVIQDPMLFSGTIYENIRYGRLDASRRDIMDAATAAGAHDFITRLPKGYGTVLGEGGSQLSGGERQRICIARAFLKDAPILILDEPTSSVDSKTEGAILEALGRLMQGRTTFMIAHRLATIKNAGHVLVLQDGRLVQQGPRERLAASEGLYRELHAAQDLLEKAGVNADVDTAAKSAAASIAAPPARAGGQNAQIPAPRVIRPGKVVVLGMIGKMPVAGMIWQTVAYLVGLQKMGYQAYYVEAHARTPTMLWEHPGDDTTAIAAGVIEKAMKRISMENRWAYHALHDEGQCLGMSRAELSSLYREAELIINLHGGTMPTEEMAAGGRLIYVETDPVERQIELFENRRETIEFLQAHSAFFTFGENYGRPGCILPVSRRFHFRPTRQPVVLGSWQHQGEPGKHFTTVGNYKQAWRDVTFQGKIYSWSKHQQFQQYLDLPRRCRQSFELALASIDDGDREVLTSAGWLVRDAMNFSRDIDAYRKYIRGSRGEFTVAKEQNVAFRTGWFSDRSATYLAAGRPVVTQETGFSDFLPTGAGLFSFSDPGEAAQAIEAVNSDYPAHSKAAAEIAAEFFSHEVVLGRLLEDVGLTAPSRAGRAGPVKDTAPFPRDLDLVPSSRRPLVLSDSTLSCVESCGTGKKLEAAEKLRATVVVPVFGELPAVRMCLESVIEHSAGFPCELMLVNNAAGAETAAYAASLAHSNPGVRLINNSQNQGFAAAVNQGIGQAASPVVVILNDDTMVTPGWLQALCRNLQDPRLGAVGPVTNRSGDEAEIPADYRTYGEMLDFAAARARNWSGTRRPCESLTMFCLAIRTATYAKVGPLDEDFAVGMFEDDDYCLRLRRAGYLLATAEDAFVHHFAEASFGSLFSGGRYGAIFDENRRRFEAKHAVSWKPHARRREPGYRHTVRRLQELVDRHVPPGGRVLVISRGDDEMLQLGGRPSGHFPQADDGSYPGHHPADSAEAIRWLQRLQNGEGCWLAVPRPAFWWRQHYCEFFEHLESSFLQAATDEECLIFDLSGAPAPSPSGGGGGGENSTPVAAS